MKRLLASLAVAVGAAFLPGGPVEAADFRVAAAPGQTPIGSMSSPQADAPSDGRMAGAMAGFLQSALEHLTYGVVQTAETGEQVVVGAYQVGGEFLGSALLFGEDALQTVGFLAADGADDLRRMGGDGLVASWVETGADTPMPDAAAIPQADVGRGTPVHGRIEARPTPETAPRVIPASLVAATPASEVPTDLCSWPAPDADDPAALTGAHVTTLSRLGLMDESAQRLPDGTVFLPKVTQRLLQVRTSISCQGQIAASRRLVGHVIANPTSSGLVQAELDGRIDVGEFGFPVIGQRVEQGELLGYLVPTLSALEKAELEAEIAVLRGEVAEQELMIARSRELPLLPFREGRILSMRIELSKLRARRDALIAGLSARQPLVAPVSGVVARSEVRAGQVVEAREVIWEIADIDDLWVEADAFATNSRVAQTGSTAETQEGTSWRWRCRARACRPRPDSRRPFTSACWMLPRPSGLASR
jgi:hypothetical protein